MAFYVEEGYTGADLNGSLDDSGKSGNASVSRVFNVSSDTPTTNKLEVLASTDLPRVGDSHPNNPFFICQTYAVKQVSPIFFEVTFGYNAKTRDPNDESDPLFLPPDIQYGTITSDEEIDEDVDGNPIAVPFTGEKLVGATTPLADQSFTIKRNLLLFNQTSVYTYYNTVNSTTFNSYPAGTVRLVDVQARNINDKQVPYWEVTATFHVRKPWRTTNDKAWYKRLKLEGFYFKNASGNIVRAFDDDNQPLVSPIALKTDGTRETDPDVSHWQDYQIFSTIDYNSLGLL